MIDTHWLENPRMVPVSYNDTTAALFALHDIRDALTHTEKNKLINGDALGDTVGSALDSVIEFLTQLDKAVTA